MIILKTEREARAMADIAKLQAKLAAYEAAESAILDGAQSYTISGRSLTRANLSEIRMAISELESRIDRASNGGGCRSPIMPRLT